MTRDERGSATLLALLSALLLLTAMTAATLWSSISTARHKLSAAADLTALSAAQALTPTTRADVTPPSTPCKTADRIAAVHKVRLMSCHPDRTSVAVTVALQIDLSPFAHPTLTARSHAGIT